MEGYYADALVHAINQRNDIEREKLKFEKEVFEFNKHLGLSSTKANEDMVEIMRAFADRFDTIDKAIRTLADNDAYLKKEIDSLNNSSKLNPALGVHAPELPTKFDNEKW